MTAASKRVSFVLAAVMSLSVAFVAMPAMAQELAPDHVALARKYVDLTDKASVYEVTLVNTGIETLRTIISQNPELLTPTNEVIGTVLESYKGKKGELLDQFARIYAQRFSMEELQQIVAFYESPVGSKLATANVEINQTLQDVVRVFDNNLKTEFFAKVRAGLKEKGIEL